MFVPSVGWKVKDAVVAAVPESGTVMPSSPLIDNCSSVAVAGPVVAVQVTVSGRASAQAPFAYPSQETVVPVGFAYQP